VRLAGLDAHHPDDGEERPLVAAPAAGRYIIRRGTFPRRGGRATRLPPVAPTRRILEKKRPLNLPKDPAPAIHVTATTKAAAWEHQLLHEAPTLRAPEATSRCPVEGRTFSSSRSAEAIPSFSCAARGRAFPSAEAIAAASRGAARRLLLRTPSNRSAATSIRGMGESIRSGTIPPMTTQDSPRSRPTRRRARSRSGRNQSQLHRNSSQPRRRRSQPRANQSQPRPSLRQRWRSQSQSRRDQRQLH
jgi:hypothetical protein